MARRSRPTDEELDERADGHLRYEVTVLAQQFAILHDRYPDGLPVDYETGFGTAEGDALLEAILVHIRLLSEFFGQANHRDIRAPDWVGKAWRPEEPLDPSMTRKISAQVAHLSRDRIMGHPWPLDDLVTDLFRAFKRFLAVVETETPDRFSAFSRVQDVLDQWLASHP